LEQEKVGVVALAQEQGNIAVVALVQVLDMELVG
jgi:hypothetical protein